MANNRFVEDRELTFEQFTVNTKIPLTIRLQEYPSTTDLWHSHKDFAELVLITNGTVINELPDRTIRMQSGDVVLLHPGSVHRYDRIRQLRHYNILFDPAIMNIMPGFMQEINNYGNLFGSNQDISEVLHLGEKELFSAVKLLENMRREKINFSPGHEEAMLADFYLFIIHILRHGKVESGEISTAAFRIGQAVRFMEEHSSQNLTLQQLCSCVHMSESSFRHHFREITGLPPMDYLIRLRLRRAALMMFHSDQPITAIALGAGFADGNYFARKFKQIFKQSPRNFRSAATSGKLDFFSELQKLGLSNL